MNLMIQPITPWILSPPQMPSSQWLYAVALALFAGLTAFFVSLWVSKRFESGKKNTALLFVGIILSVSALLLCFFGPAVETLKGIILSLLLLVSSYCDVKHREVDDYLSVMVLLTAMIGTEIKELPFMLLSGIIVSIPTLLICLLCKGKTIGGADIKLTAACAVLLGLWRGYLGLTIGLIFGIITNLIIQSRKDFYKGFPLVPYLSVGFFTAYLL